MTRIALLSVLAAAVLAGCSKPGIEAPTNVGICWHAVFLKDGKIKFNQLAAGQKNLETCAASLEAMRLKFRAFGGPAQIVGAYQGNYLFIQDEGVFTAPTLTGGRYIALVRTGDGRLAIPGAMPKTQ